MHDHDAQISVGARVVVTDDGHAIKVGPGLLGRAIDALGHPLDDGPAPQLSDSWIIHKLANASISENQKECTLFKTLVGTDEVIISFEDFVKEIDTESNQKEINRLQGFLFGIEKKLSNEKFMANAKPEIIANEQKKKEDTLRKIERLQNQS